MAGKTAISISQTLASIEATNGFFYPVTIPDHDVPFPLVDLVYMNKAGDDLNVSRKD